MRMPIHTLYMSLGLLLRARGALGQLAREGQELAALHVWPQRRRDREALWCLPVLDEAAERALGGAERAAVGGVSGGPGQHHSATHLSMCT